jgi:uncharacterized protein (TIGR02231 family)
MDTTPTAVTVFPDRARVTRTARTPVQAGLQRLEVSNLPLALIPDSVRASGKGTARARLLGVTTRLENYLDTPSQTAHELELKIQAAQDADADLAARAAVLEKEQKAIDGLAAQSEMFARGLALRNRSPEEQGTIFDFLSRRSLALQSEMLTITRSRRENAREIDRLRRMLQAQQSARPRQRYTATVELDVSSEGTLDVELTYVVAQAGWKPLYDLRMSQDVLELTYMAQVTQNTGEDWPDVAVTLSTAEPALSLQVPELDPWYIAPRAPVYRLARAKNASGAAPAPMQAMAAAPAEMLARQQEQPEPAPVDEDLLLDSATVSSPGASLTYRLSGRADIPGNNDPRKVTVAAFSLKPVLDYVTAPKREAACYRRATVKNDSPYSLLPGPAQLFEGDDYLGTTHLKFIAPGQEFEMVLGSDERMRVERELQMREVEKAFIVGERKRIRYAYKIEVENLRDTPQTVIVRDQLPVPRDEQIRVKLESADPRPADHSQLNLLEWKLTIKPATKSVIRFEFSVEHPRAMDVDGLA